jgi:GTP-binding protein HflX
LEDLNRNQQPNRKPGEERAVLVGVLLPDSNADPRDPLGELGSLCQTAGATPVSRIIQNRKAIDPGTYVGSGKALDIAQAAKAFDADFIAFDNELTPGQIGQLEKIINEHLKSPRNAGVKVLDRSEIILDIFANRAQTHEAKLQVELAQMEYTYPRLTKMWGHLERIAGGGTIGVGTRGPGETQLEIDRRLVRNRISDLKAGLQALQERKAREVSKRNDGHFTTCLVGYTNAGKSTLFNTLTAAGALAEDKLFATLDTKTRSWHLERGTDVLLSDTVGFVRDLPHNLVASFKATLEEAVHADVLLHVLDVGHPRARQQYDSVRHVLGEIGAGDNPEILLLNKVDTPEGERQVDEWLALRPDAVAISAKTGRGLEAVHEKVFRLVQGTRSDVRLRVDVRNGKLLSFLERSARINDKSYDGDTVDIHATVGRRTLGDLRRNDDAQILDVAAAK